MFVVFILNVFRFVGPSNNVFISSPPPAFSFSLALCLTFWPNTPSSPHLYALFLYFSLLFLLASSSLCLFASPKGATTPPHSRLSTVAWSRSGISRRGRGEDVNRPLASPCPTTRVTFAFFPRHSHPKNPIFLFPFFPILRHPIAFIPYSFFIIRRQMRCGCFAQILAAAGGNPSPPRGAMFAARRGFSQAPPTAKSPIERAVSKRKDEKVGGGR